jgi:glycerol dehydrogenase-like iron-containing ADH family enzyme
MANIMGAPDQYIQGPGEVDRLHEYGSRLGNEFLVVAEEQTMASWRRSGVSCNWSWKTLRARKWTTS